MELLVGKILVGFVVGVLIGLSGVGGGVLLLPVLIFGLKVPAIIAVGSDSICVHSDTPNAVALAEAVRKAVHAYLPAR